MKSKKLRLIFKSMLIAFSLILLAQTALAGSAFRGGVGLTFVDGEVGDFIVDDVGGAFIGHFLFNISDRVKLGAGITVGILVARNEFQEIRLTGGAAMFGLEGMLRFELADREQHLIPFVAGYFGRGSLGWEYEVFGDDLFGDDSDGVGFWYVSPELGVEATVLDNLSLEVACRFILTQYDDETEKGLGWDLDGGNYLQTYICLVLHF